MITYSIVDKIDTPLDRYKVGVDIQSQKFWYPYIKVTGCMSVAKDLSEPIWFSCTQKHLIGQEKFQTIFEEATLTFPREIDSRNNSKNLIEGSTASPPPSLLQVALT